MEEKFYCVGCKQHYELEVHAAQRQPSKGGSFRHSLISECPKGHRVNKLCKKEVYEKYSVGGLPFAAETDEVFAAPSNKMIHVTFKIQDADYATFYHTTLAPSGLSDEEIVYYTFGRNEANEDDEWFYIPSDWDGVGEHYLAKIMSKSIALDSEEEGNTPVQDPMEFGEMANWTPLDGTPSLKKRKRAEGMTVGVNLEALEPTPDEPETGVSMVPADSLMPEGSGHVIGSQSTSHNFTPFHAEVEMIECGNCDKTFTIDEGLDIGGIDYCEECYDTRSSKEVHSAETFIVYPELYEYLMMQDLLRSDKTSTKHLQDDDYEITVPSYLMDDILAAVSEYQSTEKSDSDLVFGQSKTTVAVAAASLAVVGAWLWNKRK